MRGMRECLVVTIVAVACGATPALALAANTYTVTGFDDPAPVPDCAGTVCPSLRAAVLVAKADPDSTVQLGSGTYTLGRGVGLSTGTGHLHVNPTGALTIVGAGSGATTIQQTDAQNRVVLVDGNGTVTLAGLMLTGGTLKGDDAAAGSGASGEDVQGAGILSSGSSSLTLNDVAVVHNTATGGAGGSKSTDSPGGGGSAEAGITAHNDGTITLSHVRVADNIAIGGHGGDGINHNANYGGTAYTGVNVDSGTLVMDSTTITGNTATGGRGGDASGATHTAGGGGYVTTALNIGTFVPPATITNSIITGNTGVGGAGGNGATGAAGGGGETGFGGAVHTNSPTTFRGTTISQNTTTGGAGGDGSTGGTGGFASGTIYSADKSNTTTFVNSTVSDNTLSGGAGGSPGGAMGNGIGAGIYASYGLTLASTTVANNTLNAGGGGNSVSAGNLRVSGTLTMADSLITGGVGNAIATNCSIHAMNDLGHNLESTTPTQCKLDAAKGDLIGVDPLLGPLGAFGGPTPTRAVLPGSPAIGAGGQCLDLAIAGTPSLDVDQRGLARPNPCTIGAFEPHGVVVTAAPSISGSAIAGQTLTCSDGAWSGDGTLTFARQWLRNGAPIVGATAPTYVTTDADAGTTVTCQVTANNGYSSAAASSAGVGVVKLVIPPPPVITEVKPSLSSVKQSATSWRLGSKLAMISKASSKKKKAPVGTTFSFTLNTASTVTLAFSHKSSGRKVGSNCVASTKSNRKKKSCTRTVSDGSLSLKTAAGARKIRFQGRISSKRKLKTGSYTVVLTAKANGKTSSAKTLKFKIVH